MILLAHIAIALASVGLATYSFFKPSGKNLRLNYAFLALTLASGVYLVALHPATMAHACIGGLVYSTVIAVALVSARQKLATLEQKL